MPRRPGYSLIEFLVVITIFVLVASLVTASYLTFERNQRLKNAALSIKGDLRFTQNKAFSGDKGPPSEGGSCGTSSTLIGWYISFVKGAASYTVSGVCATGANQVNFNQKAVILPRGVKIAADGVLYNSVVLAQSGANAFFGPLGGGKASFHFAAITPPFTDANGALVNLVGSGGELVVVLELADVVNKYKITINSSGEVSESKI